MEDRKRVMLVAGGSNPILGMVAMIAGMGTGIDVVEHRAAGPAFLPDPVAYPPVQDYKPRVGRHQGSKEMARRLKRIQREAK